MKIFGIIMMLFMTVGQPLDAQELNEMKGFKGLLNGKTAVEVVASSQHKAYVWNQETRQFYPVEAFDEIQEPDFDSKAKTITSRARDVDMMYIDTYKWKNGILTKVSTKKLSQR